MSVNTEILRTGEFILSGHGNSSRDAVTIAAGSPALVPGQVLGMVANTGKWVAYNPTAADGSEVAAGILYSAVPAKAFDQPAVAVTRACEVKASALTGLDAAARAELTLLTIAVVD